MKIAPAYFCIIVSILLEAVLVGCAHAPVNEPLTSWEPAKGYRFTNCVPANNSDEVFVVVALSGGGTRAAAFSCGALEGLRQFKIQWQGKEKSLLDEVDIISSVSGGSFASAYYGLYRDRFFSEFPERFLYKNVTLALAFRVLNPFNWPRLASPYFDRIDLAAEYYDNNVFDRHSFADLQATNARPFLLLNATDISKVSRFEFTQDQFDVIGSDLGSYHVACGVAASSAFPVLLSPLTLHDYAPAPGYKRPKWLSDALSDRVDAPREYAYAKGIESYLDSTNHPFVHLMDGGLSDNIGLRGPAFAMTSIQNLSSLKYLLNTKIKYLVVITVNSKPASKNAWDQHEKAPGIVPVFSVVANGPMTAYSDETVQYVKDMLETWRQEVIESKGALRDINFYNVSVSFDDVSNSKDREYLSNLPTTFNLPRRAVDALRDAAREIIVESPELERLRNDLNAQSQK